MLIISCANVKVFANKRNLHYSLFQYLLGVTFKRNNCTIVHCSNGTSDFALNAIDTMPKRVKSKSTQKTKRLKGSSSPNKRSSFPRSCKSSTKSTFVDFNFDFLSMPSSKVVMNTKQVKLNSVEKDRKKEKKVEETLKWSSDEELDVVYDLQEDKKNKIYEVITVMSDDETPNKITYERIYADNPEDRIVENPDSARLTVGQNRNNIIDIEKVDLGKNENGHNSKEVKPCIITKAEKQNNNVESDDEVVCVGVVDAQTKAEIRRANIEEVCLSSDSESETTTRTVPPIRLKIPAIPNGPNWSMDSLLYNVGNDSSFNIDNSSSDIPFSMTKNYLYPYIIGNNKSSVTDWGSGSSSPKPVSSDEFSPTPVNSPQAFSGDESSSSTTSNDQPNVSKFSCIDNENASSTSSSSDEENEIYWKADRESRRKGDLMYEEFTTFGKKVHQGEVFIDSDVSLTFKVMSYNVLAQKLLEEHRYLYKYHDHRALAWSRRWCLLLNEITEENPEILCLQEVEEAYLVSYYYAKLRDLGYRWIYKKRTGTYQDGVAVFYKSEVFFEDLHYKLEYYQPGVSVLDRDNVGVVVRLRPKKSPRNAIVIATTHLLYNPRRSDVKLAQTQMILAEIDRLAFNRDTSSYFPVILTGDFNLKPHNGVYKLLTEGHLKYEGMSRKSLNLPEDQNVLPKVLIPCRLGVTDCCQHIEVLNARAQEKNTYPSLKLYHSQYNPNPQQEPCEENGFESGSLRHNFNFKSVYSHVKEDGQREASTHHDKWITVDYIFYSSLEEQQGGSKDESPLQLLSRLRLPTQDECERLLRYLPNFAFGSDHLPLVGKFLLQLH